MLKGKHVLLGVTGGIASYKIATLASLLVKAQADVHVIMTENAANFINPITFETLTGHKCITDTFDRNFEFKVEHIALAQLADVVMVAPATANVMAKLAHGLADDMLTTTVLASRAPKIIAPAMNTAMYENPVTQDNIELLKHYGMEVITPSIGHLACGDNGAGKMPEPETLFQYICKSVGYKKDMTGMKVLVTAGPTQEAIDPVRYITNHSSGKMGYSIAKACMLRGADVTLVTGRTSLDAPLLSIPFQLCLPKICTGKSLPEARIWTLSSRLLPLPITDHAMSLMKRSKRKTMIPCRFHWSAQMIS